MATSSMKVGSKPIRCPRCWGQVVSDGYHTDECGCLMCGWRWYGGDYRPLVFVEEEVETKPALTPEPTRVCNTCGEEKPRSAYYRKATGRDGLMARCIECWLGWKRAKREGGGGEGNKLTSHSPALQAWYERGARRGEG